MRYYPLFLDLTCKTCLVVGAGKVGLRKIRTLMEAEPKRIVVVDPYSRAPEIDDPNGIIYFIDQCFSREHLAGCHLAFACTSDPATNDQVLEACRQENIWCNVSERPDKGDFILPGVFSRQDLIMAVSTCGSSPALTARIKKELMNLYGPEYATLTELLAGVRKILLSLGLDQEENRDYFRAVVDSEALMLIRSGQRKELLDLLCEILPAKAHNRLQGIIDALL
ncbi:precorrin-2 dehydrogenase/sirohydrochlorin ferrochelatase family protein [Desulfonatronovibrio hydrogenovorans]|uniref:precorrin-2 dehydrogenase/sirohydrochlorin ferrochelatase family protein n=1 Tax=Desulfonatronovibrio hydrogenovorans TaxID=53245 RepID=UPI0004914DBA|nr:bifunctional precorrin-2 dehydrogenase/sirohydrochlorin ferrochelatase [Desulfonatronovibrio hydrogenovorans]